MSAIADRKPYEQRFADLKQEFQSWSPGLREISRYIKPTRGFFDNVQPNRGATIDHRTVIDGSPGRSSRVLAAGMTSGLTSPSRPWFRLGIPDADLMKIERVKLWLAECGERILATYAKSNIYGVLHSIYEEVGLFGTGAILIVEDFEDVIRGRNFTIGEYFLGTSQAGRVNTFAREYQLRVGQIIEQFGQENVSEQTRRLYRDHKLDAWVKCAHLIEPNDERIVGRKDFKNMPYRSIYWEIGTDTNLALRASGFEEFPIMGPRWDLTTAADIYGRGPGWEALGDVKMLQKMQRDKLMALDKVVDPPMQADSSVMGQVNTLPGGVTRYSAMTPNGGVKPAYQIQPDLEAIEESIERTKAAIAETFYADLFLMLARGDRTEMTAREVAERHEEKLLMLGPVLERLESELLDPMISRTFAIMLRNGLLPEPPQELQGMDLKVEYISILAQAQKMVGTTAIREHILFAGEIAKVKPEVLDAVDLDKAVQAYGDMLGVPPGIVRSDEQIAQIRKAREKALQQQAQVEAAERAAAGAKTLSETKLDSNSALDALVGTRAPGAAPEGF